MAALIAGWRADGRADLTRPVVVVGLRVRDAAS
jgi:hypothetical protein